MLVKPHHKVILTDDLQADIQWWISYFHHFHGKTIYACAKRNTIAIEVDSCTQASGIVANNDWLYTDWEADFPTAATMHINFKEALSVLLAARRWGDTWSGKKVIIFSDNQAAVGMINKGSTANPSMMNALRELFWWSVVCDFELTAVYLPGEENLFADCVSRLGANRWLLQWALLNRCVMASPQLDCYFASLTQHMSPHSLLTLLPQIAKLGEVRRNSTRRSLAIRDSCWQSLLEDL